MMRYEVSEEQMLATLGERYQRPQRVLESLLDFTAQAVTEYDLEKLFERTTIAEPNFSKVKDVFPLFQQSGLRYTDMVGALANYLANTTPEEHKQNMANGRVNKVVQQLVEDMEKQESPGGKNGGEPLGSFFQGNRPNYRKSNFDNVELPTIVDLDVLEFAKGVSTTEFVEGKPRVKKGVRLLRRVEDVFFASKRDMASDADFFYLQVVQKSMVVKPPLKIKSQKKDLIVLLDDSGSMSATHIMEYVLHVLNTLFKYVLDGSIRMLFAAFEAERDTLFEVHDLETVNHLKEVFRHGHGGTTYLGDILPDLAKEIQSGCVDGIQLSPETNVLVINDGNDWVPKIKMPVVTHCISLADLNYDLKEICEDSGGQYYMPFPEQVWDHDGYYNDEDD